MEEGARDREARYGGPLAPRGLPPLLAVDLHAGSRATADLGGDEGSDPANGDRERLARTEDPELSKLGIDVSLATVSRYLPKKNPDPGSERRWITFLRNHRDVISAMDFFVVPTVRFRLLYVFHGEASRVN